MKKTAGDNDLNLIRGRIQKMIPHNDKKKQLKGIGVNKKMRKVEFRFKNTKSKFALFLLFLLASCGMFEDDCGSIPIHDDVIYVTDINGNNQQLVTIANGSYHLQFFPNSEEILYHKRYQRIESFFKIGIDGSNNTLISSDLNVSYNVRPVISSDSKRIYFVARADSFETNGIYLFETSSRDLSLFYYNSDRFCYHLSLSPNDTSLIFSERKENNYSINELHIENGIIDTLFSETSFSSAIGYPAYKEEHVISYIRNIQNISHLYLFDKNTGSNSSLISPVAWDDYMFSQDRQILAYNYVNNLYLLFNDMSSTIIEKAKMPRLSNEKVAYIDGSSMLYIYSIPQNSKKRIDYNSRIPDFSADGNKIGYIGMYFYNKNKNNKSSINKNLM